MPKSHSMSVRHSIRIAVALTIISTLLGTTSFFTYQVYESRRAGERLRLRVMAETHAVRIAPKMLAYQWDEVAEEIRESPTHPSVCLLAVLDGRGEVIAERGHGALLRTWLSHRAAAPEAGASEVVEVPGNVETGEPDLVLAEVPIVPSGADVSIGSLVCAARKMGNAGLSEGEVWRFYVGTLAMAATGMVLGLFWLNRKVLGPLRELTRTRRSSDILKQLPTDRPDEIGELARILEEMHRELASWRERNDELERSVTNRVDSEIRKITHELSRAKKEIWTDPLTRLGNRRLYDEKFEAIFNELKAAGRELSLVVLDVDHFKNLNDRLGHRAGDRVLVFLGELLRQGLREEDLAIRYGGDEFLLVFPDVSAEEARQIAERACALFAQQMRTLKISPRPTMSGGVASLWQHHALTPTDLFELADEALYRVKHSGKAEVIIARQGAGRPACGIG